MAASKTISDVPGWRLLGSTVWHVTASYAVTLLGTLVRKPSLWVHPWRILVFIVSPSTIFLLSCSSLAQAIATSALCSCLLHPAPEPTYALRFSHRLPVPHQLTVPLARIGARLASVPQIRHNAGTLAVMFASAIAYMTVSNWLVAGQFATRAEWLWTVGTCVSLSGGYLLWLHGSGNDVLHFPTLHRHRYFRLKQVMPAVAVSSLQATAVGGVIASLQAVLLPWPGSRMTPSIVWTTSLSSVGMLFCWTLGLRVLHVVYTERLPLLKRDAQPPALLLECLEQGKDAVLKSVALRECVDMAELPGQQGLCKQYVFGDDSGAAWGAFVRPCVAIVEAATMAASTAVPQRTVSKAETQSANAAARWNALPNNIKAVGGRLTPLQSRSIWHLRAHLQDARLAVRALGALLVMGRHHDTFGAMRLTQPTLGQVLLSLCSLQVALQQYQRYSYSLPERQLALAVGVLNTEQGLLMGALSSQGSDPNAYALQDTVCCVLHTVAGAFGAVLLEALNEADAVPLHGTKKEAAAVLQMVLLMVN